MITFEDDVCSEPLPANIEIYSAHFGGHAVARCLECDYKSVSWECSHELEHDCGEHNG